MAESHTGACFCGAVELTVTGEPAVMGYCHCRSCRSWSGAPVSDFTLWATGAVAVTRGEEHVATFAKTDFSHRKYCRKCGGHLFVSLPSIDMIDVFSATLPALAFVPSMHVNYAETVLRIRDGLPKMKDLPAEAGGSGETLPE